MDPFTTSFAAWLAFHATFDVDLQASLRPPADEAALARVESELGKELPADWHRLYARADGQLDPFETPLDTTAGWAPMFGHYRFLSIDEALTGYAFWLELFESGDLSGPDWDVRGTDPVEPYYWHPTRFLFASDDNGNDLAVDLAPPRGGTYGQVVEYGADLGDVRVLAASITELMADGAARLDAEQPGRVRIEPASPGTDYHPPLPPMARFDIDWRVIPHVEREPTAEETAIAAERDATRDAAETAFLTFLGDRGITIDEGRQHLHALHGEIGARLNPAARPWLPDPGTDAGFEEYLLTMDTELYVSGYDAAGRERALTALRHLHDYRLYTGLWTTAQHARAEAIRNRPRPLLDIDSGGSISREGSGPVVIDGVPVPGSAID